MVGTALFGSGGRTLPPRARSSGLSRGELLEARLRRSDGGDTEERHATDCHPGDVWRAGYAVGNRPAGEVWRVEAIAEEAHPGDHAGPAEVIRLDLEDFHLEEVARLGALDGDRPGAGMAPAEIQLEHVLVAALHRELAIETVSDIEDDGVARINLERRGDVGMPAVCVPSRAPR